MIPSEQISALNDAGFVVLSADYRLCPQVSLYDGPMQDAKDVYRWCKIEFATLLKEDVGINVNPARVVVIGYSAGGSLALHLVNSTQKGIYIGSVTYRNIGRST